MNDNELQFQVTIRFFDPVEDFAEVARNISDALFFQGQERAIAPEDSVTFAEQIIVDGYGINIRRNLWGDEGFNLPT
jgi:hypothetical protein